MKKEDIFDALTGIDPAMAADAAPPDAAGNGKTKSGPVRRVPGWLWKSLAAAAAAAAVFAFVLSIPVVNKLLRESTGTAAPGTERVADLPDGRIVRYVYPTAEELSAYSAGEKCPLPDTDTILREGLEGVAYVRVFRRESGEEYAYRFENIRSPEDPAQAASAMTVFDGSRSVIFSVPWNDVLSSQTIERYYVSRPCDYGYIRDLLDGMEFRSARAAEPDMGNEVIRLTVYEHGTDAGAEKSTVYSFCYDGTVTAHELPADKWKSCKAGASEADLAHLLALSWCYFNDVQLAQWTGAVNGEKLSDTALTEYRLQLEYRLGIYEFGFEERRNIIDVLSEKNGYFRQHLTVNPASLPDAGTGITVSEITREAFAAAEPAENRWFLTGEGRLISAAQTQLAWLQYEKAPVRFALLSHAVRVSDAAFDTGRFLDLILNRDVGGDGEGSLTVRVTQAPTVLKRGDPITFALTAENPGNTAYYRYSPTHTQSDNEYSVTVYALTEGASGETESTPVRVFDTRRSFMEDCWAQMVPIPAGWTADYVCTLLPADPAAVSYGWYGTDHYFTAEEYDQYRSLIPEEQLLPPGRYRAVAEIRYSRDDRDLKPGELSAGASFDFEITD